MITASNSPFAPFLHAKESVFSLRFDTVTALMPLIIIATVQNGLRVLVLCTLSALAAFITETLGNFAKLKIKPAPLRAATLGICIALLCPITVPIYMPAIASAVAVLIVRVILPKDFKGLFSTPAIGWLFMLSVWPEQMMQFPVKTGFFEFPVFKNITDCNYAWSLAQYLQFGEKPPQRMLDILMGQFPGGIGTTCTLAIIAITVFFIYRKSIAWQVSLSMMCTVAVFGFFINRAGVNPFYSVVYELAASNFIYVAIFIAGDIINAPKLPLSRIFYGVLIGVLTMILRYYGLYEHCVVFALTIAGLISGVCDNLAINLRTLIRSK